MSNEAAKRLRTLTNQARNVDKDKQCQVCGAMYRVGQYRFHCDTYRHNSALKKNVR